MAKRDVVALVAVSLTASAFGDNGQVRNATKLLLPAAVGVLFVAFEA